MKKGQIYEGIIEKVDFPNKGRIFTEDRVVTVKNGIPGQKVEFLVTKLRKGKAEGRIQRVLEPSPEQKEAACRHFAACGGCIYQNLPYEKQLELKTGQVKRLLDEVCEDYNFEGIKESPQAFCFRNKMEFSFGDEVKDGPLALGLHKQGSFYDIVSVPDCQIVDEDFRKILSATLTFFQNSDNTFYHKMRHEGGLRHLLVRKGISTGEILAALVTTTQEEIDTDGYVRALHGLELEGTLVGILHIKNDSLADVVKNDEMKILYGQDYFYEKLLGLRFRISPFSFFQTNTLGAEVLYRTAREYIGQLGSMDEPDQVVFDLYSGTGTIAQILAPAAKKVIGVEIVEEAVEAARENAELNGLHNCEFLAGDVLKVLDEVEEKPDFIVLDPPRDGIHPKALKKIVEYGVGRILYISCKPTSLARDLVILQESGYRVERVCCVDMFPWSGNIETVVMLSHKKPDSVINVKVEFGEGEGKVPLDNIAKRAEAYKPKERVTYKMIKGYIEAKYGFKVHTAYIAEVKRDLGLPMYDAPNAVEKLKQPRKHPTAEKVEAIKDALKHFEVI